MRPASRSQCLGLGLLMWLGATVGWCASAYAQAPGPVVVYDFRGPQSSSVYRALVRNLGQNGVQLVEPGIVADAVGRLGLGRTLSDEEAVMLARELGAVAVIEGRVRRQRRRWRASIRVRNGFDGTIVGTGSWGGRTVRTLRGVGRNGYDRLAPHLAQTRAPGRVIQRNPTPTGEIPWWQRDEITPARSEEPEEPPDDERDDEPSEPVEDSNRYDAFRISLGGGTLWRGMSTTVRVYSNRRGLNPAVPSVETIDETRTYVGPGIGHLELGGRAEVYPGAFDESQSFPFLGLLFAFAHSAGVQSEGQDRVTGEDVVLGTNQYELLVAARFRYRFGEARREPELRLDAGYGLFDFSINTNDLQRVLLPTIVPPMQHGYVHLGAGLSYGVAPPYLTLGVEVFGRIGTNIGVDTRNVWGTRTAPSNGMGLGVDARVDIADGFFTTLSLQYFMFSTDFQGQVGCVQEGGCTTYMDPWADTRLWEIWPVTPPAPGQPPDLLAVEGGPITPVFDNYVRLRLEVGWAFR